MTMKEHSISIIKTMLIQNEGCVVEEEEDDDHAEKREQEPE